MVLEHRRLHRAKGCHRIRSSGKFGSVAKSGLKPKPKPKLPGGRDSKLAVSGSDHSPSGSANLALAVTVLPMVSTRRITSLLIGSRSVGNNQSKLQCPQSWRLPSYRRQVSHRIRCTITVGRTLSPRPNRRERAAAVDPYSRLDREIIANHSRKGRVPVLVIGSGVSTTVSPSVRFVVPTRGQFGHCQCIVRILGCERPPKCRSSETRRPVPCCRRGRRHRCRTAHFPQRERRGPATIPLTRITTAEL